MEPNQNQTTVQGGGAKKTISAIIVLAIIAVGGWYLYNSGAFKRGVENAPEITREQLVGEAPLSASLESAIEKHKGEILERIGTGVPLSEDEREALGKTMLMEAHLYNFTDAETNAIFEALKVQ
ncbi:MAG: hypothetical protein A3C08_00460 [Candidatus Taylorbacteria bacterium RIFCSPHIGHO2_02_FULL_47_18]|uniref:Uncharacterized protein n=1 Tax=Candidatus Taylorbacteria bacterium RIFCSPLOWO2_01_FULL_48_100 TaxID=1802322 RepID=A0A1G2ND32_9BACT|nr:MAG: hypothetical protein A2670_00175 [Candidatus Taylorbacteria bacterium RIFCSPHIGHO2_01_FULL_48_38]OHA27832.1 MAG: hypothetical protein A3C08_00460 [Candidatus Taylorbacteria bacterium RIFCSPHIGHO2_02_FULL_47_18]OHA33943.1 MAG: hypothetical protein A2938_02900 [Candidatus Taylorbacteria bacterium RIFCSPLOWO2_01_FULL_48_100]OHA40918.1 MAG: hypothetical protein A3J31_03905 [Candidatus Taylorbacteria bacterium RIFCSPLOWO2_02_FULL_48_16]OHA45072.1 MAG: hypothetical protein A3H13_02670 [Candid